MFHDILSIFPSEQEPRGQRAVGDMSSRDTGETGKGSPTRGQGSMGNMGSGIMRNRSSGDRSGDAGDMSQDSLIGTETDGQEARGNTAGMMGAALMHDTGIDGAAGAMGQDMASSGDMVSLMAMSFDSNAGQENAGNTSNTNLVSMVNMSLVNRGMDEFMDNIGLDMANNINVHRGTSLRGQGNQVNLTWAGFENLKEAEVVENMGGVHTADRDEKRKAAKGSPRPDFTRVETIVQVNRAESLPLRKAVVGYPINLDKTPLPPPRPPPPRLNTSLPPPRSSPPALTASGSWMERWRILGNMKGKLLAKQDKKCTEGAWGGVQVRENRLLQSHSDPFQQINLS